MPPRRRDTMFGFAWLAVAARQQKSSVTRNILLATDAQTTNCSAHTVRRGDMASNRGRRESSASVRRLWQRPRPLQPPNRRRCWPKVARR